MIARLIDPWFDAEFIKNTNAKGHERAGSQIEGADGVQFWCPCGYGKPDFPIDGGRPHMVLVSFSNPRGCDPAPVDAGSRNRVGDPSRWGMTGSGLHDLTLTPSIDVGDEVVEPDGSKVNRSCWHGYVTNGEVS